MSFEMQNHEQHQFKRRPMGIEYHYRPNAKTMAVEANLQPQPDSSQQPNRPANAVLGRNLFGNVRRIQPQPITTAIRSNKASSSGQVKLSNIYVDHDAAVMNDWHDEWKTAPSDPLPSNIKQLLLLCEPTWNHLDAASRKPRKVLLEHYYPEMVPEARAQQDLRTECEEKSYLEKDAECTFWYRERPLERQDVVRAARRSKVIRLTQDRLEQSEVLQSIPTPHNMLPPAKVWSNDRYRTLTTEPNQRANPFHQQDPRQHPPIAVSHHSSLQMPTRNKAPTEFAQEFPTFPSGYVPQQTLPVFQDDTTLRQPSMYGYNQFHASKRSGEVKQYRPYEHEPVQYMYSQ
jgi:hypothetical protein